MFWKDRFKRRKARLKENVSWKWWKKKKSIHFRRSVLRQVIAWKCRKKKRSLTRSPKFAHVQKGSLLRKCRMWKRKKKRQRLMKWLYDVFDWDPGNQPLVTGECCDSCAYESDCIEIHFECICNVLYFVSCRSQLPRVRSVQPMCCVHHWSKGSLASHSFMVDLISCSTFILHAFVYGSREWLVVITTSLWFTEDIVSREE